MKLFSLKSRLHKALAVAATVLIGLLGANLSALPANAALSYSFDTWTFTPCGATGKSGPTLAMCQTAYSGSSFGADTNFFTVDASGQQHWLPPTTGTYIIELAGAAGGGSNGGKGEVLQTSWSVSNSTTWFCFAVGQKGGTNINYPETGGGGGTTAFSSSATNTGCGASTFAGGGGGGGSVPSSNADASNSIAQISPWYTTAPKAGTGTNAGQAKQTFSDWQNLITACSSDGGPLTGGSNGTGCSAHGANNPGTLPAFSTIIAAGKGSIGSSPGGGTFGNGMGGDGGFPDGGASCGCYTNGGGGGAGGGGGGGGGINADGSTGVGGGGASYIGGIGNEKMLLGAINSGDGYVKITYDYAANTAVPATASVAGTPVGSTITMGDPTFLQASGTPTYSYKWQTNSLNTGMGTWTDIPGETGKVLTIPPSAAGLYIKGVVIVTSPSGNKTYIATGIYGSAQYTHSFSNSNPPDGQVGSGYPFTFTLSGANTTTNGWALNSGALPTGVVLNTTTGSLSGTATTAGTYTFSVKHTNPYGDAISPNYTVTIYPASTISFTSSTPPSALTNDNYNFQFTATSSTGATPTYTLGQGAWPGGLNLDATTGVLSGYTTVTTGTTYNFRIRASIGSTFYTDSPLYTITVGARTNSTSATFTQPATATFNLATPPTTSVAFTPATTGSGSYTYASTSPSICSVTTDGVSSPIGIQAIKPGTCTVSLIQAGSPTYNRWVNTISWTINKMTQSAITVNNTGSMAALGGGFNVTYTGGSGTGAISYSVAAGSACVVDPITGAGQVWNPVSGATCGLQVTKAADDYYNSLTGSISKVVTLAPQTTPAVITNVPASIPFSGSLTLAASGGSFALNYTGIKYWFTSATTSVCTVVANTGVITVKLAGTCSVNVYASSNTPYLIGATSSNYSFQIVGDDQAALTWNLTTTPARVGTTPVVNFAGGSGTGSYSWATNSGASSVCTVTANSSAVSGTFNVTVLKAGTCVIDLNRAATGTYNPAYVAVTFTVDKAAQSAVTATFSPSTLTYNGTTPATTTISASGGSGTGAYTYVVDSAATSICSLSGTTVTALGAGSCIINVQRLGDSGYSDSAVLVKTLTISKSAQATVTISANRTTLLGSDVDPLIVTAAGGSGTGAYSYATSTSTVCSIDASTGVVTAKTLGTCTVTATRAADANYLVSSASASLNITISKMAQAAVTASSTVTSTSVGSATFTVTGSGGSGTGSFTYTSSDTTICTVASTTGVTTIVGAGTCVITATKASDANYLSANASVSITIAKGNQATLIVSGGGTYSFGALGINISVSGGSGTGSLSYASSDTNVCTVNGQSVTTTGAGTCVITVTKAGDNNYFATTGSVTFTITRINQATLNGTATPSSGTYGDGLSYSVSASGGTGTGAISYASNSTSICTVDSSTGAVTILTAGTCSITATKSGGAGYNDATKTITIVIAKASQTAVVASATDTAPAYVDSPKATVQVSYTGGSSTGSVSYSVSTPAVCSVDATGLVTDITKGKCIVTVTVAADTNYLVATGSVTIRFGFLDQTTFTASSNATSVVYAAGTAITVSVSGGSGTGAVSYATSSSNCSVNASTGAVTYTTAGSCVVTATKAGDIDYAAASSSVTITVTQASQTAITLTLTKTTSTYANGDVISASYTGGSGTGAVIYSTSSSACSVDGSTGLVTVLAAGSCVITLTIAADNNYTAASASKTLTIAKAAQSSLVASADNPFVTYNDGTSITISTTGGSGTGDVTYATTSNACSVNATTGAVTVLAGGSCLITATKAADGNYNSTTGNVTITIAKANQGTLTATKNSDTTYGSATVITASAIGGSGTGAVTYATSSSGICSVNATTGVMTIITAGDCVITATKAADTNYLVATATVTVTIAKAAQATFTASKTANTTYGSATVITISTTGGSGTGATTFATSTSGICSVNATTGVMTIITAGDCVITATKAADTNYLVATATVTVTIAKAAQATFTATRNTSLNYGDTGVLYFYGVGGSGTGATSFVTTTPSVCSVDATTGVMTIITAGSCTVTVTKAADTNYLVATATHTAVIGKATQATLTASKSGDTTYGSATVVTVSTSGGSGNGAVTYSTTTSGVCSVNATTGVMSIVSAGTCTIAATKAADTNYNSTSATVSITIAKANQATLTATKTNDTTYGSSTTITAGTTGGSGTGSVTYASTTTGVCSVNATSGVMTIVTAGDCVITATKAADTNYLVASSSVTITIAKAQQATATASATYLSVTYGDNSINSANLTGGSGTGAVSYSSTSASVCSVNSTSGSITVITAGTCTITVTKAADTNFNSTSANVSVTVNKANQAAFTVSSSSASFTYGSGQSVTISTTGGSGTGAVSYASNTPVVCSVNSSTGALTVIAAGSCQIAATKAADTNYNSISNTVTLTIAKANQAVLTANSSNSSIVYNDGSTVTVSTTGGSGTGATTYVSTSTGVCDVNSTTGVVTVKTSGTCTIRGTKAGDTNYLDASASVSITVAKANQTPLSATGTTNLTHSLSRATSQITVTGGSGTGTLSYAVDATSSGICTVSAGGLITELHAGTCLINITNAADLNYLVATTTFTVTIAKANQSALTTTGSQNLTYSATQPATTQLATTGGNSTGSISYTESDAACSVTSAGLVTALAGGTCVVTATKAGDSDFNAVSTTFTITIAKAAQATVIVRTTADLFFSPISPATTQLTATGGNGTGAVTYSTSSAACTISGTTLTAIGGGACVIDAVKAGDSQYLDASASYTIIITKALQTPLAASVSTTHIRFAGNAANTATLTYTGGSGTGAMSIYSAPESNGSCSVDTQVDPIVITALNAGTCVVNVEKAGDVNYEPAATSVTIVISKEAQAALTVSSDKTSAIKGETANLSATGGSTTGAITYTVVTGATVCTISGSTVSFIEAGTCTVKATRAGDSNYNNVDSSAITLTVSKNEQSQLVVTQSAGMLPNVAIGGKNTTSWDISGGNGDGALSVAAATGCRASVSAGVLTATAGSTAGDCTIDITKGESAYYNATTYRVSLKVFNLASAPAIQTPTVNGLTTADGVQLEINWNVPNTTTYTAPISGYEVQTKTGTNWVVADGGSVTGAYTSKATLSATPWTSIYARVATLSEYATDGARVWSTYGGNTAQAFQVPGLVTKLSIDTIAAAAIDTVTVTGAGFSQALTPTVLLEAPQAIFNVGGKLQTSITVAANVTSATSLTFKLPGEKMPSGVDSLNVSVRVVTNDNQKSTAQTLEITSDDSADIGLDPKTGRMTPKINTIFEGTYTLNYSSADGSKVFTSYACVKTAVVKGKKVCKTYDWVDSATCTITMVLPKNPKGVRRLITSKVYCQLTQAARDSLTTQNAPTLNRTAKFVRYYPKTHLTYILVKGKKTMILKVMTSSKTIKLHG